MNTKALRQKILDLAIHGKLVPQDSTDEPASVLLERIREEKERLIKEGKIKKPKKTKAACDKPHYPFELPKGWAWCRLEDIATFGGGKTPSMDIKEYWNNGNNLWVTSKDMKNDSIHDSLMKITDEALNIMTPYEKDTLLVVTRSGILRHTLPIAILENNATINQDIKSIMPLKGVIPKFLFYAIKANENIILTEYHKDGTTVDSIDFDKFKCLPIPLPPINEQKRIITEVLKVSAIIDCIDYCQTGLYTAIAQAKTKILDLAIHGKLVPQDPNDEPASELLKRINSKAETICDNPQYGKLPKGWCETTLGNVISIRSGDSIKVRDNRIGKYPIYGGNGVTGYNESYNIDGINIIIGRVGFYCGSVHYVNGKVWVTDNAFITTIVENVYTPKFLYYLLLQCDLKQYSNSTAQPVISGKTVFPINVMLPPRSEQHRIVAKIEELFAHLDKIEASLYTSDLDKNSRPSIDVMVMKKGLADEHEN